MSRNGSGTYTLASGNPVTTGTSISSTTQNNTLNDMATALTASIANDGQTPILANLPMSGFRHTGVHVAGARTDYSAAADVQDGTLVYLTGVAGTNTITATAAVSMSAYAAGQKFHFIAAGANTGAATLNINSIGAKAITKNGTTALVSGDIASGAVITVVYDGTQFQMRGNAAGGPITGTTASFTTPLPITSGGTGQITGRAALEALGFYTGNVSSNGNALRLPSGWSSIKNSTGDYTVTHNLGNGVTAGVIAAIQAGGAVAYTVNADTPQTNSFQVRTFITSSGVLDDHTFAFLFMLQL